MADTLIRNATLVNEGAVFVGDLLIHDGRIAEIIPADEAAEKKFSILNSQLPKRSMPRDAICCRASSTPMYTSATAAMAATLPATSPQRAVPPWLAA